MKRVPPEIQSLLLEGEGERLDFKQTISSAQKIAKTLVAFANHKGGKLLVGIRDNKSVAGIRSDEELYMIESAAQQYCRPEVPFSIREWQIEDKTILEVNIPEGNDKPYKALDDDGRWMVYVRNRDESRLASKIVADVLKGQSSTRDRLIKYTSKEQALLDYLSRHPRITLKQYCKMLNLSRPRAQKIIVNLILSGVIRSFNEEKFEYYCLA